jgi:hypothetical protein
VARAISGIILKNQGVLMEFYGPLLDFTERQGANCKMVGIFPGVDLFFNGKITVDSVHHPLTAGTLVHGGLAMAGQRGLTGAQPSGCSMAQWLTEGGATGRREGDWGEVRWRMAELSLYIGAKGEGGGW